MTRTTQWIAWALLLSLPITAIGCQSAGPAGKPATEAEMPRNLSAADIDQRTAAALQASDRATGELANTLAAINNARAIVMHNMSSIDTTAYKATRARCENGKHLTCLLDLTQGSLESTGRPLDVGVQGQGFFTVRIPNSIGNGIGYTRNGNFVVNKAGELVLNIGDGYKLVPPLSIPASTTDITIGADGTVSVLLAGQTTKQQIGQLKLTQFINAEGLQLQNGSIFIETESSGPPTENPPGCGGTGQLLQGFLEKSNVDINLESFRLRFFDDWRAKLLRAAGERD